MQTLTRIMTVDGCGGVWTDEWGAACGPPEIAIGLKARLRLDLRQPIASLNSESGTASPVDARQFRCDSYYLALDSDYLRETDPKLLRIGAFPLTEEDGRVYLEIELPDTATAGLLDAVAGNKNVELAAEIGGFDGSDIGTAGFVIQFPILIRNRVYLQGDVPSEVSGNPEYLTAVQIHALMAEATRPERGDDGRSAYEIAVEGGYAGSEAEWLESLRGAEGLPGKSAYEIAKGGGYAGSEAEWLESLRGAEGLPGDSAYEVAVAAGFAGTAAEWLESLRGRPGDALKFDATGQLSERAAYDNEPEGFTFGATETDPDGHAGRLYICIKRSGEFNDWHDPLVITYHSRDGKDGANAALIPPLEFTAPPPGKDHLYFNIGEFPAATVAAVCIDTPEGELRLPYDSALGVRKIVKTAAKMVYVYFGSLVPAYATGRIYFAQGVTTGDSGNGVTPRTQYSDDGSAWHDEHDAADRYVRFSFNAGMSWTPAIPLTVEENGGSGVAMPQMHYSANGTSWHASRNTAVDLYMRFSFDDGATWSPGVMLLEAGDRLLAEAAGRIDNITQGV